MRALSCVVFTLLTVCSVAKASRYEHIKTWQGGHLKKDEGGFFMNIRLRGFSKDPDFGASLQILLKNLDTDRFYTLNYELGPTFGQPFEVWRIRSGSYLIARIRMIYNGTRARVFIGNRRDIFKVSPLNLSNFGLWTIRPSLKKSLTVSYENTKGKLRKELLPDYEAFAAMIHGRTGEQQQTLGGSKLKDGAKKNYSSGSEMRAVLNTNIEIYVGYKLDAPLKFRRFLKPIATVLNRHDLKIRECYLKALQKSTNLRGSIGFRFALNRGFGRFTTLKNFSDNMKSVGLRNCIYGNLATMEFQSSKALTGTIIYLMQPTG